METKTPTFSPNNFSLVEKKQSAGFYTVMNYMLNRHQESINTMRRHQIQEIEAVINLFSLRFEEFQTVFDWKQNLQKSNEMNH